MTEFKFGRFGFDVRQDNVSDISVNGDSLSISGRISSAGSPQHEAAISQVSKMIRGTAYPLVIPSRPDLEGMYILEGSSVKMVAGSKEIGWSEFTFELSAVGGGRSPLFETRSIGTMRPNNQGRTTHRFWTATPDSATAFSGDAALTTELSVKTHEGRVRRYISDATAAQKDLSLSYRVPVSQFYVGAASVNLGVPAKNEEHVYHAIGRDQVHVIPGEVDWILVEIVGAAGGGEAGGRGAKASYILENPGSTDVECEVRVGTKGTGQSGGWPDGGDGGFGSSADGYGGGGSSSFKRLGGVIGRAGGGAGQGGAPAGYRNLTRAGDGGGDVGGTDRTPGLGATGGRTTSTPGGGVYGPVGEVRGPSPDQLGGRGADAVTGPFVYGGGGGGGYGGAGGGAGRAGSPAGGGSGGISAIPQYDGGGSISLFQPTKTFEPGFNDDSGSVRVTHFFQGRPPILEYQATGLISETTPFGWSLSNGIVRLSPVAKDKGVQLAISCLTASGWSEDFVFQLTETGAPSEAFLSGMTILRNSSEVCVVRCGLESKNRMSGGYIDITVSRGMEMFDVFLQSTQEKKWGWRSLVTLAASSVALGVLASTADASGRVHVIAAGADVTDNLTQMGKSRVGDYGYLMAGLASFVPLGTLTPALLGDMWFSEGSEIARVVSQ